MTDVPRLIFPAKEQSPGENMNLLTLASVNPYLLIGGVVVLNFLGGLVGGYFGGRAGVMARARRYGRR